ncbi:ATP-binding protein [Patescibacteria group bacterium]|nr:ATP-binding protein [Patescibacteria group bacterium]
MNNIATTLKNSAKEPVRIKIILPTTAYFMSGIRDFTLSLIHNMTDFSEQWAYRFQSVVDELCNNAIEHGSRPGEEIQITFINNTSDSLEIVVEDSGTGEHPMKAAELDKLIEEKSKSSELDMTSLRGRGLTKIVKEWTDELRFEDKVDGGLRVIVKKYLHDTKTQKLEKGLSLAGDQTHIVI